MEQPLVEPVGALVRKHPTIRAQAYNAPVTIPANASRRSVALDLLETRVDVAVGGGGAARLADAIATAWDRCLSGPGAPAAGTVVQVFVDDDQAAVGRARDRGMLADSDELRMMHWLSSKLTVAAISAHFGELWMLHACAVAEPTTGATAVLVAASGTGKTTAAVALGRHFGYVTDETAAIRLDGTLLPYPKPLSVLVDGQGPKQQQSPSDLGLLAAPATPWLAAIALLDRNGSGAPRVDAVRTVEALPALAEQTSALQRHGRPLHMVAEHLHRTGGLRRISYREAEDLVPVVAQMVAGAS